MTNYGKPLEWNIQLHPILSCKKRALKKGLSTCLDVFYELHQIFSLECSSEYLVLNYWSLITLWVMNLWQAWNAFIAFWTGSVIRGGGPVFFALFSLPFWFVGFGWVYGLSFLCCLLGVHVHRKMKLWGLNFWILICWPSHSFDVMTSYTSKIHDLSRNE